MASMVITRLKKSKQAVRVTDAIGTVYGGEVSSWDDTLFSISTQDGDDVFFPVQSIISLVVMGGYEKREEHDDPA